MRDRATNDVYPDIDTDPKPYETVTEMKQREL